jgi:hypothetical protein
MRLFLHLSFILLLTLIRLKSQDFSKLAHKNTTSDFILYQNGHSLFFNPRSGLLEYRTSRNSQELISDSVFNFANYTVLVQNDSLLFIDYPARNISCRLEFKKNLDILVKFTSTESQSICWPRISISKINDHLIWPGNEGYYIPFSDSLFAKSFNGRKINSLSLSLPFWAIEDTLSTIMYEMINPFRNEILFEEKDSVMDMKVQHLYTSNSKAALKEPHYLNIIHLSNHSPITPALYYRKKLEENNDLVTFDRKIESLPMAGRMIGAPLAHLIPALFITKYDILEGKMIPLAKAICKDGPRHEGFVGQQWSKLKPDQRDFLKQIASSDRLNNYQVKAFVRMLGGWFHEEGVNEEFAKDKRKNAELFYAAYPGYLLPPEQWGVGVSFRMIDALRNAGINRMILQAEGHQIASDRREVAGYAFDQGYLFGVYDSYHSIHDPSSYGTDNSWETAQMQGIPFDSVRMMKDNGSYYAGFKSLGGLANSRAIRSYFEKRISEKFDEVSYSYYFIDCDAFGEYYDDYSTLHPITREEDAAERMDRLKWLRDRMQVPIGSEKGIFLFSNILDVNEGVTVPFFGLQDEDMKNKNSEYYRGAWWPPEMLEIKFKEVPVKEKYWHLYLDPRFKIPLWETVYHDCLISTAHPLTPSLKYSNVKTDIALTEMFYQYPPLYNLNYDFFLENKDRIVHHYEFYSKTHAISVRSPVTEFEFLTRDRLVQRIQFGGFQMVANYGKESYQYKDYDIPAKSILYIDEDGTHGNFSPENF